MQTESEIVEGDRATAVLRRARQHLQRGWCQGYLALDGRGRRVAVSSPRAVRFCAVGAIQRAADELLADPHERSLAFMEAGRRACDALPEARFGTHHLSLSAYNDVLAEGQEPILRIFDRAIGGK